MVKRNKKRWLSAALNNQTFSDYYNRLSELALNVFEWVGLPPTVDERFLELQLFERGYCLYFKDEVVGDLALSATVGGRLSVYNIPLFRRAFATNGYNKICSAKNSVIIYNNYLHTPTTLTIELFARRLYEIERAIDVNVKGQKTPTLILCSEQQRLTMQNLYMQYDGNEPFIFGNKDMDMTGITVLKTDAPYVADKLEVLKHNIWNEALTFLGIENANQDKKERLVADEVESNYGHVEAQRNVMLNSRKKAAELINRKFGTDIQVRFRSNLTSNVNSKNVSRETLKGGDVK